MEVVAGEQESSNFFHTNLLSRSRDGLAAKGLLFLLKPRRLLSPSNKFFLVSFWIKVDVEQIFT